MVTVTLGDLVTAESAVDTLLAERLPAKAAYRVARLARVVKVETAHFQQERDKLIRELGAPGQEPNTFQVPPDKMQEFAQRINELASVAVPLDAIPLTVGELPETVSGKDLLALGALLDGEG